MKPSLGVPVALMAGLAIPSWCAISIRSNPKAGPIRTVCVMPPEARLTRVGMKGGADLAKEAEAWSGKLDATVRLAITHAGGLVAAEVPGDRDDESRQAMVHLRQKYENISIQMRKKPSGIKNGRYTLGDEVALVPCAARSDALAFVDAIGLLQSGGRKAFDILTGGAAGILLAQGRYVIWIALVDSKSGEVTATIREVALGGRAGTDPEGALTIKFADSLKKLHVGAAGP